MFEFCRSQAALFSCRVQFVGFLFQVLYTSNEDTRSICNKGCFLVTHAVICGQSKIYRFLATDHGGVQLVIEWFYLRHPFSSELSPQSSSPSHFQRATMHLRLAQEN